ncbi:hypothetical protein RSK20926_14996 [Roseobacter sp. SK209-2-6]|nr:hypothetical protein RSK20926_14996 [Roseobacter sp. SK209-2-6]
MQFALARVLKTPRLFCLAEKLSFPPDNAVCVVRARLKAVQLLPFVHMAFGDLLWDTPDQRLAKGGFT